MSYCVLRIATACTALVALWGCSQKLSKPTAASPPPSAEVAPAKTSVAGSTGSPSVLPQRPLDVLDPVEPPKPPGALLSTWRPPASDPPDVAAIKLRLLSGETSTRTLKELQRLMGKHGKNAELPYLLGQLYFTRLWVGDGLKAFRRAIALDPQLRENPFLLRAAITGLANDSDHRQVARFLGQDIGTPALPYLEEALYGEWRSLVKERAEAIIRSLK